MPGEENPLRVLLVTGGHPFEAQPFFDVFDADAALTWTHVAQPEAQAFFHPDRGTEWDVFVLYDMPGIEFTRGEPPARFLEPASKYMSDFGELLESGRAWSFSTTP